MAKSPSDLARIPVSIEPSSLYLVGTNERDHLALTLRDTTTEKMITAYAMKRSETTAALASMIAKRPDARFLDSINDINTTGAFTSTSRGHSSGMNLGMAFSPLSQNFDPVPSAIKAAVRLETDEGSGTIMITEITDPEESTDTYVASNQSEE